MGQREDYIDEDDAEEAGGRWAKNSLVQCLEIRRKRGVVERADPDHFLCNAQRSRPEGRPAGQKDKRENSENGQGLALYAAKVAVRFIPGKLVEEKDVDKIAQILSPPDATTPEFAFINRFERDFDELLREYLGKAPKLTVFIDDLDRCLPENAIVVLESLKLYLDRARCVFVIGAESSIVEEGIKQRYSNSRLSARDYIEKIVQLPFMMQRSHATEALRLISEKEDPFYADPDVQALVVEGTTCNPRRLKRFLKT